MITFSGLREKINKKSQGAKDAAAGLGKIAGYLGLLSGIVSGSAPLTIVSILQLAAEAVNGSAQLIQGLSEPTAPLDPDLSPQERFEICFHLLCQNAHAEAIKETLKKRFGDHLEIKLTDAGINHLKSSNKLPQPMEVGTSFTPGGDLWQGANQLMTVLNGHWELLLAASEITAEVQKEILVDGSGNP